jgi:hypothetical protein
MRLSTHMYRRPHSGTSNRRTVPVGRAAAARLVQDLHPHDRGPQGIVHGAIIANGNLYCPATRSHCCTWAR